MKSKLHHSSNGPRGNRVCVRVVGQGVPVRLSREDAHRLVALDHDGEYCKKSFFKQWRKDYDNHPEFSRITDKGEIVADV